MTTYTDNFNSYSNYSDLNTQNSLWVYSVNGRSMPTNGTGCQMFDNGNDCIAAYTGATFNDAQYASIDLTEVSAYNRAGVAVRCDIGTGCYWGGVTTTGWSIGFFTANVYTQLASGAGDYSAGGTLRLSVDVDGNLELSLGASVIGSYDDTANNRFAGGGTYPGFGGRSGSYDNFDGGDLGPLDLEGTASLTFAPQAIAAQTIIGSGTSALTFVASMLNGNVYTVSWDRFSVTFQATSARTVGYYATGDPWVHGGPIELLEITPASATNGTGTYNGATLDPACTPATAQHGFDSRTGGGRYNASLNVNLALESSTVTVTPPSGSYSSLVVTEGTPTWPSGRYSAIDYVGALTILAADAPVPATGAFRPSTISAKTNLSTFTWTTADVNMAHLPGVALPPSWTASDITTAEFQHYGPFNGDLDDWANEYLLANQRSGDYYRSFNDRMQKAACIVVSDQATDTLIYEIIQRGLDNYNAHVAGSRWGGTRGQSSGRWFQLCFAAVMLDAPSMFTRITNAPLEWAEFCQTFYVEETSPGVYNGGIGGFTASDVGSPAWGNDHCHNYGIGGFLDTSVWIADGDYRRCCSTINWIGMATAAKLLGIDNAIQHNAFFDYVALYVSTQRAIDGGNWLPDQNVLDFYDTYYATTGTPIYGTTALSFSVSGTTDIPVTSDISGDATIGATVAGTAEGTSSLRCRIVMQTVGRAMAEGPVVIFGLASLLLDGSANGWEITDIGGTVTLNLVLSSTATQELLVVGGHLYACASAVRSMFASRVATPLGMPTFYDNQKDAQLDGPGVRCMFSVAFGRTVQTSLGGMGKRQMTTAAVAFAYISKPAGGGEGDLLTAVQAVVDAFRGATVSSPRLTFYSPTVSKGQRDGAYWARVVTIPFQAYEMA